MRVGIIGAMAEELEDIRQSIQNLRSQDHQGLSFDLGEIGPHQVVLLQAGIGKVNATIGAVLMIETFQVDCLINTGSAAGVDPGLRVGDMVLAHSLSYHDVDVTGFGYAYGQMAGMPLAYQPDTHLTRLAQEACRVNGIEPILGLIVSGDQFINSQDQVTTIRHHFPKARACEMESTAIAQTCQALGVPYVVARVISDDGREGAAMTFDEFIRSVSGRSANIVRSLVQSLPLEL